VIRKIEVVVFPDGKVSVQTRGFSGPACLAASRFLEKALGTVTAERRTAEFYDQVRQAAEEQQRQ